MKFFENIQDSLNTILPILIFLSLLSMLFIPMDNIQLIKFPIIFAVIFAILYWLVRKK